MKRERLFPVVFIALTIGFYACQKESSNKPSGPSTLGVKIQALNKSYSLPVSSLITKSASLASSSIVWDTAQMVVSAVKFDAGLKSIITHRDSIQISYKWTGPQNADLLDTTLAFGNFVLQPGFYDELELTVYGFRKDAVDKPVFYLHGTYTNSNSTSMPLMVKVNEDVAFKTEKDSVDVSANDYPGITSYIQLYLDQLMTEIQPAMLDNATLTGGIIVISPTSNRLIYSVILRNLIRNHHCYFWHKHGKGFGHD